MATFLRADSAAVAHSERQGRPAAASEPPPDAVSPGGGDEGVGVGLEKTGCAESMYGPWQDHRSRLAEPKACSEAKGLRSITTATSAASR